MSAKWIRSKQWDDRHLAATALRPVRAILRLFSSVWLGVGLLVLVAVYGTLASVPIGLLAKVPTFLLYALTAVVTVGTVAIVPMLVADRLLLAGRGPLGARVGRAGRFVAWFVGSLGLALVGAWVWYAAVWPLVGYRALPGGGAGAGAVGGTGGGASGLLLFRGFVERYGNVTLRRLPGMEMSELEFYSWWPLRVILLAFVTNMVVATLRRIEFAFVNIGVIAVHTGIVTIAMGSVFYQRWKQEGDMLLVAGAPDERGKPSPGPTQTGFFDRTEPALWISMGRGYEQRPLRGLPRYNDYGLGAAIPAGLPGAQAAGEGRTLQLAIPAPRLPPGSQPAVDPDLSFTVVGYASYARIEESWLPAPAVVGGPSTPLREVDLLSSLPEGGSGPGGTPGVARSIGQFRFIPDRPADRIASIGTDVVVEYTRGLSAERLRDLATPIPGGAMHGLVVEIPSLAFRGVYTAEAGKTIELGATGYRLEVRQLLPQAPFPIITKGYEGAESSVAVVRVSPPPPSPRGESAAGVMAGVGGYDRWVYSRFPEISQDLLDEVNERGMPRRRDASPDLRITYLDASPLVRVSLNEPVDERGAAGAGAQSEGAPAAAIVRVRSIGGMPGTVRTVEGLREGSTVPILPVLSLRIGARSPHAVRVETPVPVPEAEREKNALGTHQQAALALRVAGGGPGGGNGGGNKGGGDGAWSETVWVTFSQFAQFTGTGEGPERERTIALPDGRSVTVFFGRRRFTLPGMALQLKDFEMFPYPHSDEPRDYRSEVVVLSNREGNMGQEEAATSLNEPLKVRVPYQRRAGVPGIVNLLGRIVSLVAPVQYKFSQSGWDSEGWRRTKALAEEGRLERPFARFTILGVGNNPGIYVIAGGAVLMSVGIPWAFYVKPLLVRAKKRSIQKRLGVGVKPAGGGRGTGRNGVGGNGAVSGTEGAAEVPALGARS